MSLPDEEEVQAKRREQIAHSLFAAGNNAYAQKNVPRAEKLYTKALSHSPPDALRCTIFSNRSAVRLKLNDLQGAENDAREAIRLNPCWAKAQHRLGSVLIAQDRLGDAWSCFKGAVELERQNMLYHNTMKNVERAMIQRGDQKILEELKKGITTSNHQYVANHDSLMSDHITRVGWLKISTPKSLKWQKRYVEVSKNGEVFASSDTFGANRETLLIVGDNATVVPSNKYSRTLKVLGEKRTPHKVKFKMETHKEYTAWMKVMKDVVGKDHHSHHADEMTKLRLQCDKNIKIVRAEAEKKMQAIEAKMYSMKAEHQLDLQKMLLAAKKKGATHSTRASAGDLQEMQSLRLTNQQLRAEVEALTKALDAKGGAKPVDPAKRVALQRVFDMFDKNRTGSLNLKETAALMRELEMDPSDDELIRMVEAADTDNSGEIEFEEFVSMMSIAKVTLKDLRRVAGPPSIPTRPPATTTKPAQQWQAHVDPASGKKYYFNEITGITQWHRPLELGGTAAAAAAGNGTASADTRQKARHRQLSPAETAEARRMFVRFDTDKTGNISIQQLAGAMRALGLNPTDEDLIKMVNAVDEDNNGIIDFDEFVTMLCVINVPLNGSAGGAASVASATRKMDGGSTDSKAGEAKQGSRADSAAAAAAAGRGGRSVDSSQGGGHARGAGGGGKSARSDGTHSTASAQPAAAAAAFTSPSGIVSLNMPSQKQINEAQDLFDRFDVDHSQSINADELVAMLSHLGHFPTPDELHAMLDVADSDQNGELDFNEFMQMLSFVPRDAEWEEFEDSDTGKPYFRHKRTGRVMWNRLEDIDHNLKAKVKIMFPPQSRTTDAMGRRSAGFPS